MKKILIVTDAWAPHVNGVTRTLETHIAKLKQRGYEVTTIGPNQFTTVPLPMYPEIPLALLPRRRVAKIIEEFLKLDLPGTKLVIGDGPDCFRLEDKYGKKNMFVGYKRVQELVNWLSLA